MKIFENKSIFKKVLIVLICILILSFCIPKTVQADAGEIGGKLLNPVMSLFVSLGDGAMALLQKVVFHADASLINVDSSASFWSKVIVVVTAIAIAAVAIAAVVITGGGAVAIALGVAKVVITVGAVATITFPISTSIVEGMLPDSFYLPLYTITPQEIFSNKIPLLDVDFFNPTENIELDDGTTMISTATQLRPTISNWYTILRDISLVALLSILVYTGIRILISSTSNDKAKYKQMLVDWIVAICLLFIMQYIMAFSNLLVEKFIDLVDTTQVNESEKTDTIEPEVFIIEEKEKVEKAYETIVGDEGENSPFYSYFIDDSGNPAGESSTKLVWPAENFMQQARIKLQLLEDDKETYVAIGWKLIFVVLVVFTFVFMFTYLKRVVYMTFLTLIAPLVALTYPIDKMTDGKAQAFNAWFKEYIFNLLIQPMHLILYTVLISSAMDFASENILYVIVVLAFMMPAEKLLRKFFGFNKAETPGLLGGAAGAAVMMSGINKLFGKGPKPGKVSGGKGSGAKEISDGKDEKIKFKDSSLLDDNINTANIGIEDENKLGLNEGNNINNGNYEEVSSGQSMKNNVKSNNFADSQEPENIADKNLILDNQRINDNIQTINGTDKDAKVVRDVKKLPKYKRFVNAGVRGIKKSTNTLANRLGNNIKEYNPAKTAWKIAKTGAKVAVGGTTGLVAGSIAGITSGDPSKAVQYASAGALGGYKMADSIDKKIADDALSNTGFKEAAVKGYYGDDYDQHMIDKKVREIQNNYDNKQKVIDKFDGDKKQAKEFMNDVVPEYVNYGITDMKDIMATYKLEESGVDRNKAIYVATNVNDYGKNTSKLGAKDSDDLNKTIENRARKNKKLKTEKDIKKVTKDTRDLMDRYSKIKFSK